MKFCTNCGAQLDDGTKFCTECGQKLGQTPAAPESALAAEPVVVSVPSEPAAEQGACTSPVMTQSCEEEAPKLSAMPEPPRTEMPALPKNSKKSGGNQKIRLGLIAVLVIRYIAMYDLYTSCTPQNNVLFLVLSIFFSVTEPFFVFFIRNKDEGMPPRRQQPRFEQVYQEM